MTPASPHAHTPFFRLRMVRTMPAVAAATTSNDTAMVMKLFSCSAIASVPRNPASAITGDGDTVGVTDGVSLTLGVVLGVSDTVGVTDGVSLTLGVVLGVSDTVGVRLGVPEIVGDTDGDSEIVGVSDGDGDMVSGRLDGVTEMVGVVVTDVVGVSVTVGVLDGDGSGSVRTMASKDMSLLDKLPWCTSTATTFRPSTNGTALAPVSGTSKSLNVDSSGRLKALTASVDASYAPSGMLNRPTSTPFKNRMAPSSASTLRVMEATGGCGPSAGAEKSNFLRK